MSARAIWSAQAVYDLECIVYHIAVESGRPSVSESLVVELRDKCLLYASEPLLGEVENRLGGEYRRFRFKRWIVIYRRRDDGITVLRIVDGARDFDRLFDAE